MPDAVNELSDLVVMQTGVVTVCVALMIWLGLLARPGRATRYWTYGYLLALLASYGSMTSAALGADVLLQPVAIGLSFGLPALVWSGLRVLQGKRAFVWTGIVQSFASVLILWATAGQPYGFVVFTVLILAAAIGAGLGAVEVLHGAFRGSRFGVPLVAGSAVLLLLGLVGVIHSTLAAGSTGDLDFVRGVVLATTCYIICVTVSLLFLANRRAGAADILEAVDDFFPEVVMRPIVREKLLRAAKRSEQNWSFVDIRLDDVVDLREATGDAAFSTMVRRLEDTVADAFPADADLFRIAPGHVTVFVAQPSEAVRLRVRSVLNSIGAPPDGGPTTLRITASAGIIKIDPQVDDYPTVTEAAARATEQAQLQGGDRWVRVDTRTPTV
ncbi:hypothetical protein [Microbacterium rhizomatis]|uniref:GGDEF domain-containing protein n=1 Tax=Microbacterium rhizomatis TaxID=1631477 RepID=A0A5J5IZQ1_9MICO|nr:hypothetical protein [Microbacterium rhizomatis]KAA9107781.1 hypothetical protein F6B43_10100 [Microbacterium rhizomatis]